MNQDQTQPGVFWYNGLERPIKSPSAFLVKTLVIGLRAHLGNQGSSPHIWTLGSSPPNCPRCHCPEYKPCAGSAGLWQDGFSGTVSTGPHGIHKGHKLLHHAEQEGPVREGDLLSHRSHSERLGGCAELAAGSWVSALSTGPRGWSAALDKVLIEQNKTILNFATSSKSLPYRVTCAESRAWDPTMSSGPVTQATPISCVP